MRKCASTLESEMSTNETDSLIEALARSEFTGTHLEIGTAAGGTLCKIVKHYLMRSSKVPKFLVIDSFKYFPDQFELVKRNLKQNGIDESLISFHKANSYDVFNESDTNGLELDFILIDANHKLKYVIADLRFTRFLRSGGILCVHDYSLKHRGVYIACNHFMKKYENYSLISKVGSLLILKKERESKSLEISLFTLLMANVLNIFLQFRNSIQKRL